MKRKQINRGKKWLVAVLPPTTFVTITNQKCQLYLFVLGPRLGLDSHRPEGISRTSREIHLGRSMPSGTPVSYAACLDEAISAASRQGNTNTTSYGEASLPR